MKKIIIPIIFIIVIIIVIIGVMIINSNNKDNDTNIIKNKNCTPITGGGYSLIFETNSDKKIDSMHICIACAPDTYEDIPTPIKEGYKFIGWYYDKDFKNKVEVTNTYEINPVPRKDNDCIVGYKDITLYAKWERIDE